MAGAGASATGAAAALRHHPTHGDHPPVTAVTTTAERARRRRGAMLAAENRVRRPADFTSAVRGGRRAGGPRVVVHLRVPPEPQPGAPARAGLIVSKAVGGAVVRTGVKRRLRHVVAPRLAGLPPGSLVVLRASAATAAATSEQLAADVDRGLARCLEPRGARR